MIDDLGEIGPPKVQSIDAREGLLCRFTFGHRERACPCLSEIVLVERSLDGLARALLKLEIDRRADRIAALFHRLFADERPEHIAGLLHDLGRALIPSDAADELRR